MKKVILSFAVVLVLAVALMGAASVNAAQSTCPDGGNWTKIDSDDLSSYPVDGATDYCFKAGSDNSQGCTGGLFGSIPAGGFGNNGYCGLSHWSFEKAPGETETPPGETETPPGETETPEVTPTPGKPDRKSCKDLALMRVENPTRFYNNFVNQWNNQCQWYPSGSGSSVFGLVALLFGGIAVLWFSFTSLRKHRA